MTITLGDKLGTSALSSNPGALESPAESANTPEGPSFGQFMTDMLHKQSDRIDTAQAHGTEDTSETLSEASDEDSTDGQQIADVLNIGTDGHLAPPAWPLKEMTLGPNFNVITPQTAAPDSQSLEAFARAQGLDEKAVSWLFGTPNAATTNLPGSTPTGLSANANLSALTTSVTDLSATSVAGTADNANPQTTNANNLLAAAQALWAMADGTASDNKTNAAVPATSEAPPIQLMRMPPPAAVWMQRGLVNGVAQETVAAQKADDISESELDLGGEWGPDLLNDLFAPEGTSNQGSSTTGTQGTAYANFAARWDAQAANRTDPATAGNPAPTETANTAARSENIQNLADKMGQAVGQRILSEMERGQWHLKLQLRPATLGHIEVEMRMRSGEFDAVFTAPNATTRELLQDGMSKLRETLGQMGMDVANIHVGNGQTGQSGGDSTPGSRKEKTTATGASAQVTATETTRAPLVKATKDGLDVLV